MRGVGFALVTTAGWLTACSPATPPQAPMAPAENVAVKPASTSRPEIVDVPEPSEHGNAPIEAPPDDVTTLTPLPSSGGLFDRGAAAAALGGANVQSCASPGGPTGSGHVTVTFGPDGRVQSARLDSGPFMGTPVGNCILSKFAAARVPPFSAAPTRVGKSFVVR